MEPSNRPQPNRGSPLVQFLPVFVALLLCAPQLAGAATNSFPTLNAIGNRTINEDAGLQTVNLSGITTGSTNDVDTLTVTATSDDTGLIPNPTVTYTSPNATGSLSFTPVANSNGSVTITVTVNDNQPSNNIVTRTFTVTVNPVNDAPHIAGLGTVPPSIGDSQPVSLFSGVSISDIDHNNPNPELVTVTVTNLTGAGDSGIILGAYLISGSLVNNFSRTDTPANLTAFLQGVQFVPAQAQPGVTNSLNFSFKVADSSGANAPENTTKNLRIAGTPGQVVVSASFNPSTIPDDRDALPFRISITDPNLNDTFTVAIVPVSDPGFAFGVFTPAGPFAGTKTEVESAMQTVRYTPVKNKTTNSQAVTFRFTVTQQSSVTTTPIQTLTIQEVNDLPDVNGAAINSLRINDDQTNNPFSSVSIQDVDRGGEQPVSVTITIDNPVKGTLSPAGPFALQKPASVTTAIRAVTFTPTANRLPVSQSEAATFTITVTDILGGVRVNNVTTVVVTSVNGAPQILGLPATQPLSVSPEPVAKPFAAISVTDDDPLPPTVTITLDNPAKGTLTNDVVTGQTFAPAGSGVYQFTGNPTNATAALQDLIFQPSDTFPFPPDAPGGTTFKIEVVDSSLNKTTKFLSIVLRDQPRNFLVTRNDDDSNPGSLRHAALNVENNGVITFALSNYPALIRLTNVIELRHNVTLKGPGADLLTISGDRDGNGQPDTQLFRIAATVKIEGLTLTKGQGRAADDGGITGGAVYVGPKGHLTMRFCAVTDSQAPQWGGAIDVNQGSLAMDHCLVRGNSIDSSLGLGGGAISLYTTQACSFVNTTFSANRQRAASGIGGGALYAENFDPSSELSVLVSHCTFVGNEDAVDEGTSISANVFGTFVTARNSIFSDGQARNLEVQGGGQIISQGGNLSDDSSRTVLTQGGLPESVILLNHTNDLTSTNILLLSLNFGLHPTPAYPLQAGSPAIGQAVNFTNAPSEATDQRGVIRDSDPDSGAVEFGAFQRLVINEIHFDPRTNEADFVEFYVLRDSTPVNLSSNSLWVDGVKRHVFTNNTILQPGRGIVVADTNIFAGEPGNPTVVVLPSEGPIKLLKLENRGQVELRDKDNKSVLNISYLGVFADPSNPAQNLDVTKVTNNSITLAPQFVGFALLPHRIVAQPPLGGARLDAGGNLVFGGETNSPGRDTGKTAFGSLNALPLAENDSIIVGEDELFAVDVLANDHDADGLDQLVVVNVAKVSGLGGDNASTNSTAGAQVRIAPTAVPLRGTNVVYDPRHAALLQSLPEGARLMDEFYYTIVDMGTGPVLRYETNVVTPASTIVYSPGHRLATNTVIVISGSSVTNYNRTNTITPLSEDRFTIPVAFKGDGVINGSWVTRDPRSSTTNRSEAKVIVTVIGANDPPTPGSDSLQTTEEKIVRIMADILLAGTTNTVFDTDDEFPAKPEVSTVTLLQNDTDPDADDNATTLKIVGVSGRLHTITNFEGTAGSTPVIVRSPGHGLADGTVILISGYGGHPSYNGFQPITLIDLNTYSIPVRFIDNDSSQAVLTNAIPWITSGTARAVWGLLNDGDRLTATSELGAAVKLEIRTDRSETSIIYNPRTSEYLNGTAVNETNADAFYYAVEDRHGAVSFAQVTVQVSGVNDAPLVVADPGSLALLAPLVGPGSPLGQVISQLKVLYYLLPTSGDSNQVDTQVQFGDGAAASTYLLPNLWVTDEDTLLDISSAALLGNDSDVDRTDHKRVKFVSSSREGASVSTNANGLSVRYDPTTSTNLNKLAREETLIDTFEVTITDDNGGDVTNLVAVLVIGANDSPRAKNDNATTPEDQIIVLSQLVANDEEDDINGLLPDNRLLMIPVTNVLTTNGASVTIVGNTLTYNPTNSAYLNGLAQGSNFVDSFQYTVMDGSFVFANNDLFKVQADGSSYVLNVLSNDRNFTGQGGELRIISVGTPNKRGSVAMNSSSNSLVYSPEVNFVGDEVFTYTVSNDDGYTDTGLVTVRVTVNQLNGNLQANADYFSVAKGESPVLNVLGNDNILPASGQVLTITQVITNLSQDEVKLVNHQIIYVQKNAGPFPYTNAFQYEISGGGTARAMADVIVRVIDREDTLPVRNDFFNVRAGSRSNALDVLFNDNILPGSSLGLTIKSVTNDIASPLLGQITINPQKTGLIYTPNAGFVGQETIVYVATDGFGGTGRGTNIIFVGGLTPSSDFFVVNAATAVAELDVLANDGVIPDTAGTVTIESVATTVSTNPPIGTISVKSDKTKLLFQPSGGVGVQEFIYTISDGGMRTASGKVTVTVMTAGVRANPDYLTVSLNSLANNLDVLRNDAAIPDQGRTLTIVSLGTGVDAPNHGGIVVINEGNSQLVYAPAPGFIGEETFTYVMTDSRGTDTAKVVVRVAAGELAANNDAFTVFFESVTNILDARKFTLPVLANDRVVPNFGQALSITGVGIDDSNATNAPSQSGTVASSPDGLSLIYTPSINATIFPYVESFTYEITDGTARRDMATVEIRVEKRAQALALATADDAFTVVFNSLNNGLSVLANDGVKPAGAGSWTITGITQPAFHGVILVAGSTIFYTPPTNFIGTDYFTYSVSDGLGGTGSATVSVKVGDLPVCEDVFTAISGSTNNILDVLANDAIRLGTLDVLANDAIRPGTLDKFKLFAAQGTDQHGTATVNNGLVLYTPDANSTNRYPYLERFDYLLQNDSLGMVTGKVVVTVFAKGSDRSTATLFVNVTGVNDAPTSAGTSTNQITDKQTIKPFPTVVIGEVDDHGLQALTIIVRLDNAAKGVLTNLGSFSNTVAGTYIFHGTAAAATAAIRELVFDPTDNRITVPTTNNTRFIISMDDGFVATPVIDDTTIVAVIAVNDPPIISGTVAGQKVYHRLSIRPFAATTITEVDDLTLQPLRVMVRLSNSTNGFLTSLGGFTNSAPGVYTLGTTNIGVTAAAATVALRGLVFVPTTGSRVAPGVNETTTFTISVEDGFAPTVVDNTTSVIAIHGLVARLLAGDATNAAQYGYAVSASRDLVAVGAPADIRNTNSGSVYLYARSLDGSNRWTEVKKLVPSDGKASDQFGSAVALDGDTVVVGARLADASGGDSGAAYIFSRHQNGSNQWGQVKKLVPTDGAANDYFANAVAISGDTVVIGAPLTDAPAKGDAGSVYVFGRNQNGTNQWGQVKKILAGDALSADQFGTSVAIDSDTLVVGARFVDAHGTDSGAAYVFARSQGTNWLQTKKITPDDGAFNDLFGAAVAVNADTIVVGAPLTDSRGGDSGSAYVYSRNSGTNLWAQVKKLIPADGAAADQFGTTVSVDRDLIAVAAPLADANGANSGAAYVFGRNQEGTNQWGLIEKLAPTQAGASDQFGFAVSIRHNTLAVGAPFDGDGVGTRFGSAYMYRLKFNNSPLLGTAIPDQMALVGTLFSFPLSAGSFVDADFGDTLNLSAALAGGAGPLPMWLGFNPVTVTFSGTPSNFGRFSVTVTATDEDGASVADTFDIVVLSNGPQFLWLVAHFGQASVLDATQEATLWGNNADPDHDGVSNLQEYLNGSDPNLAANADACSVMIAADAGTGQILIRFKRRTNDPRFTYTLQTSANLGSWSSAASLIQSQSATTINSEFEMVTLRLTISPVENQALIFRISVQN